MCVRPGPVFPDELGREIPTPDGSGIFLLGTSQPPAATAFELNTRIDGRPPRLECGVTLMVRPPPANRVVIRPPPQGSAGSSDLSSEARDHEFPHQSPDYLLPRARSPKNGREEVTAPPRQSSTKV